MVTWRARARGRVFCVFPHSFYSEVCSAKCESSTEKSISISSSKQVRLYFMRVTSDSNETAKLMASVNNHTKGVRSPSRYVDFFLCIVC